MEFNVKELQAFLSRAKAVKTNTIIPILSSIFFDGTYLVKTNNETFYRAFVSAGADAEPVLLDEQKLSSFLSPSNIGGAETVTVTVKEKTVVLSLPGGGKPLSFAKMDHKTFPSFPQHTDETAVLEGAVLRTLYAARNLVSTQTEVLNNFCFIHLTEEGIYASNYNSFFHYATMPNVGAVLLSREAAGVVGNFEEMLYSRAGNYDFFTTDREAFAFIKPEQTTPLEQFKKVLEGTTQREWMEFQKADFVAFCELVTQVCPSLQSSNPTTMPDCSLSVKDKKMILTLKDDVYSVDVTHEYDIRGKYEPEAFQFNPKLFLSYLKALPYDSIRFSPYNRKWSTSVWTVEDEAFSGILTHLVHQ